MTLTNDEWTQLNNLTIKAGINFILPFTQEESNFIDEKVNSLAFSERANLLRLFRPIAGTFMYDAGSIFLAQVAIDDKNSDASENFPLAYIKFKNGNDSRVEIINIIESVRQDATLIAHPAILFAIQHWQELIRGEKYSKQDNVYSKNEEEKKINYLINDKFIEAARKNLKAIGKALLEGAKNQAVSKELALALKIKGLGLEKKNTYLYVTWDRLKKKHVNPTDEADTRISKIENYLKELPANFNSKFVEEVKPEFQKYGYINSAASLKSVIDFLRSEGRKFVYDEREAKSKRPRWKVFQNAYLKWLYGKEISTIENYRKKAEKQDIDEEPYTPNFLAVLPEANVYELLYQLLTSSLVEFCPPIQCSEEMADSHRLGKLIDQSRTK